jgi:hypothetical protein
MKRVLGYIPWLAGYPSPRPRKISIDMEAVVSAWVGVALRSLLYKVGKLSNCATKGGIDKNLRKYFFQKINLKYGNCRSRYSNKESFQKKTWQHLRIVPIADIFVRLCPTNKSPILTGIRLYGFGRERKTPAP